MLSDGTAPAVPPATADDGAAPRRSWWRSLSVAIATRVAALVLFVAAWQVLVLTNWKPQYLLPSPFTVLDALLHDPGAFTHDAGISLTRAALGLGAGIVVGGLVGLCGWCIRPLRAPLRSVAAGLQTLPAVAWYPAALIVIAMSSGTIVLVAAIGATPPIAKGILDGVATAPRRTDGPRLAHVRHVVVPAMLPASLAGLRAGWRACWVTLLAGELLLTLPSLGLGGQLSFSRGLNENVAVYEGMIVLFLIGVAIDGGLFGGAQTLLNRRRPPDPALES